MGHRLRAECYVLWMCTILRHLGSEMRRMHLFSGTTPANDLDVKSVTALCKGKAGKVIMFEDSF